MSEYAKNIQTIEDMRKKRIELRDGGGRMSERYEVDGFEVVFTPWHSEFLAEDFMSVSVRLDGYEVFHAGMTKLVPSVEQARKAVETMTMLEEAHQTARWGWANERRDRNDGHEMRDVRV